MRLLVEKLLSALCPELKSNYKSHPFEMDLEYAKRVAQELYVVAGF
jgi:hypothetical protein